MFAVTANDPPSGTMAVRAAYREREVAEPARNMAEFAMYVNET